MRLYTHDDDKIVRTAYLHMTLLAVYSCVTSIQ